MRNVKSRSGRKSGYVAGLMDDLGLYQYGGDPAGMLRNNEKDTTKAWWHAAPQKPAGPLRRPPHYWYFDKTEDVGAGSLTPANVGSGTPLALIDRRGGWATSLNAGALDDYYYYFGLNELASLVDGRFVWFDTEIEILDVDKADLFIGLCAKLGSGNLFDNRVDCVGFQLFNGSAAGRLNHVATKDGTGSPAYCGHTLADETAVKLSMVITGQSRVDFYVNDGWTSYLTSNLPDDEEMAFAFGLRNNAASPNAISITTTMVLLD